MNPQLNLFKVGQHGVWKSATRNGRLLAITALSLGLTLTVMCLLGAGLQVAHAVSFTVTTTADDYDGVCDTHCSLRDAIVAANQNGHPNTISLGTGTYVLTRTGMGEDASLTGDLDITSAHPITIVGVSASQTIIDATGIDRIFDIRPGAGKVAISGLTIYNGNSGGVEGGGIRDAAAELALIDTVVLSNTGSAGGGVYIDSGRTTFSRGQIAHNTGGDCGGVMVLAGTATLSEGQIFSNTGISGGGLCVGGGEVTLTGEDIISNFASIMGGGISIGAGSVTLNGGQIRNNIATENGGGVEVYGSTSTFTLTNAIIQHNFAKWGAGINIFQGRATLNSGQIISNTAQRGGGICNNKGKLTLLNSTVSSNYASEGYGGGFYNDGTSVLTYTSVVSNTANSGPGGIHKESLSQVFLQDTLIAYNGTNCSTFLNSHGHNLEDGDTCGLYGIGDMRNTNPLLGPLTLDSGTWVHPLLAGSPAINHGACIAGITTDQRGVSRMAPCDIGAYEAVKQAFLPLVRR